MPDIFLVTFHSPGNHSFLLFRGFGLRFGRNNFDRTARPFSVWSVGSMPLRSSCETYRMLTPRRRDNARSLPASRKAASKCFGAHAGKSFLVSFAGILFIRCCRSIYKSGHVATLQKRLIIRLSILHAPCLPKSSFRWLLPHYQQHPDDHNSDQQDGVEGGEESTVHSFPREISSWIVLRHFWTARCVTPSSLATVRLLLLMM